MELNVAGKYQRDILQIGKNDLHKGVGYRHSCDNHDIHKERYNNDTLVEADQTVVLGKTVTDQICLDSLEEIPVKRSINEEIQELLGTVPIFVNDVVSVADLKACWDPNVEDTDVDCRNENSSGNHDASRVLAVWYDNTDTVDDDLQ